MTRRDVLKYFSAGSSVVPIIGGLPFPHAQAKLIEEPKVEIEIAEGLPSKPELPTLVDGGSWHVEVRLKSQSGQELTIVGKSFITNGEGTKLIFNSDGFITELPYPFVPDIEWELRELLVRSRLSSGHP